MSEIDQKKQIKFQLITRTSFYLSVYVQENQK